MKGNALKVGVLALLVLFGTFYAVKALWKGGFGPSKGYHLWALFKDATGLVDKSRVQIAGLNVGSITKRELPPEYPNRAKITILIDDPNLAIWDNARVFKKSASLLGEFYLDIDPGNPETYDSKGTKIVHHRLKEGDQILVGSEPPSIGDIQAQISETLPILKGILEDVHAMTSGPVREMIANANRALLENSEALKRLLEDADRAAVDIGAVTSKERQDMIETIKNVRDITEGVKQLVGTQAPTKQRAEETLAKVNSATDKLDHALQQIDEIATRTNAGHGTVGRLLHDETIAENVSQITEDASGFIKSLTRLQ